METEIRNKVEAKRQRTTLLQKQEKERKLNELRQLQQAQVQNDEDKALSHEQFARNYQLAEQSKQEQPSGSVFGSTWAWMYETGHKFKDVVLLGAVLGFIVFR